MADGQEHMAASGVRLNEDGTARFRIWAPSVADLALVIGDETPIPMRALPAGWFEADAPARAGTAYRYRLPDGTLVPDPASRMQETCVHGASIIVDPRAYGWKTGAWRNRPWHEAVIYEVHPGAWGGFAGIQERLRDLSALGVTAIELMPVADFPGARSWGYDGVLPFAPDRAYGTPDELRALVDATHAQGMMILLDVVYNHFGPDGAYLHVYAKEFFDADVHTPWGAAIDFKRREVQAFFIENALMWLRDYRFDGLRFDAVHAISPPDFLRTLEAAIRAGVDRPVHLVLEHEGNKSSILRAAPEGPGFDAQWADDWHHCLHVLLTGEKEGYYESFQNPAEQLAEALAGGFVYQGQVSLHHGVARGEPSAHLPPTAFVVCLQNHDQIGNRAMGERLSVLAHPQALRAATTLLLLQPFIPLLFMGEEWGSRTPFLFFTDHNDELAELVREGRREEFKHFAAFQNEATRARIPDPNAASTFLASIPDSADAARLPHREVLDLHRQLLALRKAHVIPGIPGCTSLGAQAMSRTAVRAAWRLGNGTMLTLLANFGDALLQVPPPAGMKFFSSSPGGADDTLAPYTTTAFLETAG